MANQPVNSNSSDEIDLGQLFQIIGKGFDKVFHGFLRLFIFIKKNVFILLGLAVIGAGIGYGLNQITSKKLKTEIIVRPNLESKEYLYDVVSEIQANIESKNKSFFSDLDIDIENFESFKIKVEPLGNKKNKLEDELKYLELLKGLEVSGSLTDIVRNEILERNSLNHKIIFIYKDKAIGQEAAEKIMNYINSNTYFSDLVEVYRSNATQRIEKNTELIEQVDKLIEEYTENIAEQNNSQTEGRIVLDTEEEMDVKGLFELKSNLTKDTEAKKIELKKQTTGIRIINLGKPQEITKPFFGKKPILLPMILISIFFIWSIVKYLNQRAMELGL